MPEIVPCPVCRGNDLIPFSMTFRPGYPHLSRTQCRTCGVVFANPMATEKELSGFYSSYYDKGRFGEGQTKQHLTDFVAQLKGQDRSRTERELEYFRKYYSIPKSTGNFLDIGCGLGRALVLASLLGFEVAGTEYDPDAIQFCKGLLPNAKFVQGNLHEAKFLSGSFDFVLLYHVIEHVRDPHVLLAEIRRVLKPNGICFIGTPNIDAPVYGFHRVLSFLSLHVPSIVDGLEHTIVFSKPGLSRLLTDEGFEIVHHRLEGHTESFATICRSSDLVSHKLVRLAQKMFNINQVVVCRRRG